MQNDDKSKQNESPRLQSLNRLRAAKFSRTYLLILLILISILFFNLIKVFLVTILIATVFTTLFYPLYETYLKLFRGNKSASSAICCLSLLLGLIIPIYAVGDLVAQEAINIFNSAVPKVREIIEQGDEGILGKIKSYPMFQSIDFNQLDWQSSLQDIAKNASNLIVQIINKTSQQTFHVIADLFVTLFTMFYFFRDGDVLVKKIKYLSPLDDVYEEGLIHRFISVSRATIKGTILIGLIQGSIGGLTLWITGVEGAILWTVVMIILAVIPLVGGWLVMYPAAIVQLITGNIWQGLTIIAVTVVIISNIDNLLRPRLVGRDAGMHDLMIFFSTLGGISVFGIMGFIIGPVIAVFFLTILDIYSVEFKSTLDLARGAHLNPASKSQDDP